MMIFLDPKDTSPITLRRNSALPERCHVFHPESVRAVNAALAAGRPLLLLGEPGVGKSQLARAVAKRLRREFVSQVIDSQTESRDLLYSFDAVQRLADAQLLAAQAAVPGSDASKKPLAEQLASSNYLRPGPLWWAFDWQSAEAKHAPPTQEKDPAISPARGAVLLIDEIDKGQPELSNGLLEALGDGQFRVQGRAERVRVGEVPPLIIITSNDERELPDAFVRRCLVWRMRLPAERQELIDYLCLLGAEHQPKLSAENRQLAAEQLADDRSAAQLQHAHPLPGLAEYLDTLRALAQLHADDEAAQRAALKDIARYTSAKYSQLQP